MKAIISKSNRAQVLVLFAIALLALVAMAALLLDGGQAYMNRRAAQAAADAGALAAAKAYCYGATEEQARAVAIDYATVKNRAMTAEMLPPAASTEEGKVRITVNAHITMESFFANIFGQPAVTASASASSDCFNPGIATHVLPVSWSCRTPDLVTEPEYDCQYKTLDWETQLKPMIYGTGIAGDTVTIPDLNDPPTDTVVPVTFPYNFKTDGNLFDQIYIIMDSASSSTDACPPFGTMDCDFNNDGLLDLMAHGDRSWLDLDGLGGGTADLVDWIHNGYSGSLAVHYWLAGQDGVTNATFHSVQNYQEGKVVIVPVFNAMCNGDPNSNPTCLANAHAIFPAATDTVIYTNGASTTYFHLVAFAPFFVSCVDAPPYGPCPGHNVAVSNLGMANNMKTIEGYFVTGYPLEGVGGTGGADLGTYIISLVGP